MVLALELLAKSGQYVGALTDREMGVRARDYRRPFKLNMNWTEPPAEIDFEWTSVIEVLARMLRCGARPPQGAPAPAACLGHLQRLHLSLLAVDDYDLTSIREKMPQLEVGPSPGQRRTHNGGVLLSSGFPGHSQDPVHLPAVRVCMVHVPAPAS